MQPKKMRLKKLEIVGFKSFADKTLLEFSSGVTAIVGPNGCGKSNIADAFRWVLGEQSAKSMRGNKMPDVIFSGTDKRRPVNFAEVTLTLSNDQGLLPIEYDEIAITRRLHRSGESEYFLNRHSVRLKEIQDLLLGSGMGRNAFSIFEQGKMEQVVQMTPTERRRIFEDAAGIGRFLQRAVEARKKLEQVDFNLLRANDIVREVEKQIELLSQQAEQARLYAQRKERLEALEKGVSLTKWTNLKNKGEEFEKQHNEAVGHVEGHRKQVMVLQEKMVQVKNELSQAEHSLAHAKEGVYRSSSAREIRGEEQRGVHKRLQEIGAKEKEYVAELARLRESEALHRKEITNRQVQLKEKENVLATCDKVLKQYLEEVRTCDANVAESRQRQQQLQKERLQLVQSERTVLSESQQSKVRLENIQEQIQQIAGRKNKLQQQKEEYTKTIIDKQTLMQQVSQGVDAQKAELLETDQKSSSNEKQITTTQKELEIAQRELTEHKARQKVLVKMQEEMAGFSSGGRKLLQEAQKPTSPLCGKVKGLHEYFQALSSDDIAASHALAGVLRAYPHTLVVETQKDLEACLEFVRQQKIKEISLICLEHIIPKKHVDNALCTRFHPHLLIQHLLGSIITADALIPLQKEIWIEKENTFVDHAGVIFYGIDSDQHLFVRTAELQRLEKTIQNREQRVAECTDTLRSLQQNKAQLQSHRNTIDKEMRREEMKLVEINFALRRLQSDLDKTENDAKQIEADAERLEKALQHVVSAMQELGKKHSEMEQHVHGMQGSLTEIEVNLERKVAQLQEVQKELQEAQRKYQQANGELQREIHAISLCEVKLQEGATRQQWLEREIDQCQHVIITSQQQQEQGQQAIVELDKELQKAQHARMEAEQLVNHCGKGLEQVVSEIKIAEEHLRGQESIQQQFHVQLAQTIALREAIEQAVQEQYQMSVEELAHSGVSPVAKLEPAEREMRGLRQQIASVHDINMTAIEESEKSQERHQMLTQQVADLTASKQELVTIITQLEEESGKMFATTFESVRTNFKKNFGILFNGGEADLVFTEAQEGEEMGVEIIARPPGKQMRSIQLMSGGEKCLTAMALLFAIFEVRPSPFCILDEIDAPLDDANVERFANVVKQFVDKCQFLIVTHNKRTMAIADVLFGVSMQEKGVSKILSMSFESNKVEVNA